MDQAAAMCKRNPGWFFDDEPTGASVEVSLGGAYQLLVSIQPHASRYRARIAVLKNGEQHVRLDGDREVTLANIAELEEAIHTIIRAGTTSPD